MQDIQLVYVNDNTAKYRIRKNETYGENTKLFITVCIHGDRTCYRLLHLSQAGI
jgi:hypothetical protein